MIILPVSTPAVAIDQNSVKQSEQNDTQALQKSRKATETVQISSEARQLAGAESKNSNNSASTYSASSGNNAAAATQTASPQAGSTTTSVQQASDNEAAEVVADSEVAEQQSSAGATAGNPEAKDSKISVVI